MTWNYRAIKETDHGEDIYRVYEVYYDKAGELNGWTEEPICPQGDTLEELRAELTTILVDVTPAVSSSPETGASKEVPFQQETLGASQ